MCKLIVQTPSRGIEILSEIFMVADILLGWNSIKQHTFFSKQIKWGMKQNIFTGNDASAVERLSAWTKRTEKKDFLCMVQFRWSNFRWLSVLHKFSSRAKQHRSVYSAVYQIYWAAQSVPEAQILWDNLNSDLNLWHTVGVNMLFIYWEPKYECDEIMCKIFLHAGDMPRN